MRTVMWTYPWDVQDLSADIVEAEFRSAGLETVSLATSYHAGRFLQPRSPVRKSYYPEDGTIYFNPTPARWADVTIKPVVARVTTEGGDVLDDLIRRRTRAASAFPAGPSACTTPGSGCSILGS